MIGMITTSSEESSYLTRNGYKVSQIHTRYEEFDGFVLNWVHDDLLKEDKFTLFMVKCVDVIIHAYKNDKPVWFVGESIDILEAFMI